MVTGDFSMLKARLEPKGLSPLPSPSMVALKPQRPAFVVPPIIFATQTSHALDQLPEEFVRLDLG
jgi:hypothetical protein